MVPSYCQTDNGYLIGLDLYLFLQSVQRVYEGPVAGIYSLTYGDVLTGFPLPMVSIASMDTRVSDGVMFIVGSVALPRLVNLMLELIDDTAITPDPRPPTV
jgi:hypothetical protein